MDISKLKEQLENAKKLASSIKQQNTIFEATLQEAVKGAKEEDKPEIERVRVLSIKAMALAREGKSQEAQDLIKQFKDGSQSN